MTPEVEEALRLLSPPARMKIRAALAAPEKEGTA